MFTDTNEIMILARKNSREKVYKLKLDREAKEEYVRQFNLYINDLLYDDDGDLKEFHDFENNYFNSEEENFKIDDFQLSEEIKYAIDHPDVLEPFVARRNDIVNEEGYQIKAILIGNKDDNGEYCVAGQKFSYKQILVQKGFNLILTNDTFKQEERKFIIAVPEKVDCLLQGDRLVFQKYSYANGVFDLSSYYREASNDEINTLKTNDLLSIEDVAIFDRMVQGVLVRKKIAKILDIHALDDMQKVKTAATNLHFDLPLTSDGEKIIWPQNKAEQKVLLKFLAEELYSGSITSQKYISNSTRKA